MKKIRLGIIGCGNIVRHFHLPEINKNVPEFQVVAMVDTDPSRIRDLRRELLPRKRVTAYTDYRKMLREARPDAVLVSTPHTLHFEQCRDAFEVGAHVLVDKPMVTSPTHARRLVAKARKADCRLMIATQGLYTNTLAYARKLVTDGTLGPLQLVSAVLAQEWLRYMVGSWRVDPKLSGGGQLYDSGCHVLSAMLHLVGSPAREVFCWADNKGTRVDINAVATVRFANGCLAGITSGANCNTMYAGLFVQGQQGLLELDPFGGRITLTLGEEPKPVEGVPRRFPVRTVSPVRNFADAILGRAEPRCDGHLGVLLAELVAAFYASAASGRPAAVSPRAPRGARTVKPKRGHHT